MSAMPDPLRPTNETEVVLSDGRTVALPVCHPIFTEWSGRVPDFDFGKKPVLDYKGESLFAELVILRMLQEVEWDGAWIETYGGTHFLRSMPQTWSLKAEHVSIPEDKEATLRRIWETAKTTACFDVFAWKDDKILFCEAKQAAKDKLTQAQLRFIEGALACGIAPDSLVIVEWKTNVVH